MVQTLTWFVIFKDKEIKVRIIDALFIKPMDDEDMLNEIVMKTVDCLWNEI